MSSWVPWWHDERMRPITEANLKRVERKMACPRLVVVVLPKTRSRGGPGNASGSFPRGQLCFNHVVRRQDGPNRGHDCIQRGLDGIEQHTVAVHDDRALKWIDRWPGTFGVMRRHRKALNRSEQLRYRTHDLPRHIGLGRHPIRTFTPVNADGICHIDVRRVDHIHVVRRAGRWVGIWIRPGVGCRRRLG